MSLRNAAFTATRWTSGAALLRAMLQIAQTMVLARLLAPQDYGLIAMAAPVTAIAALLSDIGLAGALMHFPRPDRRTLSTIYWLNLGAASTLCILVVAIAWPVTLAYAESRLLPVLCLLSLAFPLNALGQPFRTLAEKNMQFPKVATQEVAATICGFIVAMAAALANAGVYALVAATLSTAAASSAFAWLQLSKGNRPCAEFALREARPFLAFGLHRLGSNLWNALSMQADVLIAALNAAPAVTALYTVPRDQCLRFANTLVNPVVTRVSLPVMAQLQNDSVALRRTYLQSLRMTASLNFPFYALLALFPEQVVALLLGGQWQGAGYYLQLFAVWGLIRSTGNPSGALLGAVGLVRRAHAWNIVQFFVTVPVLWISVSQGGLPALAGAMCGLQAVSFWLAWRFLVMPACGAGLREYSMQFVPPLAAAALACAASRFAVGGIAVAWQLPIGVLIALSGYALLSNWLNRQWVRAMLELLAPAWGAMTRRWQT